MKKDEDCVEEVSLPNQSGTTAMYYPSTVDLSMIKINVNFAKSSAVSCKI